jgi:hypothetical protein
MNVLHESTGPRKVRVVGEHGGKRIAVVVVPRDEVDRHGERRQQLAKAPVLLVGPGIDEVARGQHDVGARPQAAQVLDGAGEIGSRVHSPVGEDAFRPDVHVGDLGDDHS